MAFSASMNDGANITAGPELTDSAITQFEVDIATEANGSIDPFAPYFGEGGMIEQSVVYFDQQAFGQGVYRACFLAIPC